MFKKSFGFNKKLRVIKMGDLSGIGKSMNIESGSTSLGCTVTTNSEANPNSICHQIYCPSYGKWWCPFSGW